MHVKDDGRFRAGGIKIHFFITIFNVNTFVCIIIANTTPNLISENEKSLLINFNHFNTLCLKSRKEARVIWKIKW